MADTCTHWLHLLVVVVIVAGLRLATCGRVATRHIVIFLVAGLLLATLRGLHVVTSLIINYSFWRHIRVRKGRGRGPGRKRGAGAKARSRDAWLERCRDDWLGKRQRSEEGWWHRSHGSDEDEEGWWHRSHDKDEDSWERDDDDSWGEW